MCELLVIPLRISHCEARRQQRCFQTKRVEPILACLCVCCLTRTHTRMTTPLSRLKGAVNQHNTQSDTFYVYLMVAYFV